jgi:hypothetical protein
VRLVEQYMAHWYGCQDTWELRETVEN